LVHNNPQYLKQLLISHDIASHEQLVVARGNAYAHILTSVSAQLTEAGLTESDIDTLLRANPAALLSMPGLPPYDVRDPVLEWGKSAWYWHRSVRTSTPDVAGIYFPPEHVPVLRDPDLAGLSATEHDQILANHLAMLLRFTIWLELNPVAEVCRGLYQRDFEREVGIPDQMQLDALRILGDEVAHADLCGEYLRSMETLGSDLVSTPAETIWDESLRAFLGSVSSGRRQLALLCFVIASETTITSALELAPRDQRVRRRVRELLRDHADDERRHHEYFAALMRRLWLSSPTEAQEPLASLIVHSLELFLFPSQPILEAIVRPVLGIHATEVVSRVIASSQVREEMRGAAAPALITLRDAGAFRTDRIRQIFVDSRFEFSESMLVESG
jgi:hypothetical protein